MPDYTTPEPRRWPVQILIAAALVVGVGGLLLATRSEMPAPQASAAVDDRSPRDAVALVASWLDFNDSQDELLDREHRRATVERFVARDARTRIAGQLEDAAQAIQVGGVASEVVRSAPIGYRVLRFSRSRAVVETWELVIRGASESAPGIVSAHSRVTLLWQNGWRIADVAVNGGAGLRSTTDVATADDLYRSFRHVP